MIWLSIYLGISLAYWALLSFSIKRVDLPAMTEGIPADYRNVFVAVVLLVGSFAWPYYFPRSIYRAIQSRLVQRRKAQLAVEILEGKLGRRL